MLKCSAGLLLVLVGLCGCVDKQAATASNMEDGLNHAYARMEPCPNYTASSFPITLAAHFQRTDLDALEAVGLVSKTSAGVNTNGQSQVRYDLTSKGRDTAFTGKDPVRKGEPLLFCFGQIAVKKIVNFTEPAEVEGMHVSRVTYRVELKHVPSWASNPAIEKAFPSYTEESFEKSPIRTDALVQTHEGWRREDDE